MSCPTARTECTPSGAGPGRRPEAARALLPPGGPRGTPATQRAYDCFLFWIQASEEAVTQGGEILALVIIMLSALEERVSGFYFLVFLIT